MRTDQTAAKDIDAYIAGFPNDVREMLEKIRESKSKREEEIENICGPLLLSS